MEDIEKYITENPALSGFCFFTGIGIFFLSASIYDWDFLFGGESPNEYNLKKIEGLVNVFGRKTIRVFYSIGGILLILGGFFWAWAYSRYIV